MRGIAIRPATTDDVTAISTLVRQAVRTAGAYPPDVIARSCANFSPENVLLRLTEREVFVGEIDGRVVGTVSLRGDKLYSLFVAPDQQGKGVGRDFVAHV